MKVGDSSTVSRGFLECFADPREVVERLVEHRVLEELPSAWWSAALDELLGAL